jgi:hypothetical protein
MGRREYLQWHRFGSLRSFEFVDEQVIVGSGQVVTLAEDIIFQCGTDVMSYHAFYSVMCNICMEDFPWIDAILTPCGISLHEGRANIIFDLLGLWNSVGSTDLLQTMWLTTGRLAINKRDKVFGILGIASDSQDIVPAADYSLTVSDLYWSLAESMIAKCGDLDYLSTVFDRGRDWSSSPWVPTASRAETYMFNTSFFEPILRTFSFHAANDSHPIVQFNGQTLEVEGFIVDVVDGLGPSWSDSSTAACQPCSNRNKYFSEAKTFRAIWMAMVGINELSSDGSLLAPDISSVSCSQQMQGIRK